MTTPALGTIRTILKESVNKRQQLVTKLEELEHLLKEVAVSAQEAKQEVSANMPYGLVAMDFYEGFYYRRAQKPNEIGTLVTQPSGIEHLIMMARQIAKKTSK